MELRHLRYFVAVAEEGSITRAAGRLNIQQPPLGQQLRLLEAELGVQLFDRAPKRITLNAAGMVFLMEAREVLARAQKAIEHVQRFDQGETGTLRVGFTSSASLHSLTPHVLGRFRQAYPWVGIAVEESETYELALALQSGRIDLSFSHVATKGPGDLASSVLAKEGMVLAMPVQHPFAQEGSGPLDIHRLAGERLVVYRRPEGYGIFEGILRKLDDAGIGTEIIDEVTRMVAAINLVAAGRGVSIVPVSMTILHPGRVIYRPLSGGVLPPLPLYIAYRGDERLQLVRRFVEMTRSIAGDEWTAPDSPST